MSPGAAAIPASAAATVAVGSEVSGAGPRHPWNAAGSLNARALSMS
ncbi:hypothetical protein [Nocardia sp. NPDC050710]